MRAVLEPQRKAKVPLLPTPQFVILVFRISAVNDLYRFGFYGKLQMSSNGTSYFVKQNDARDGRT